MTEDNVSNLILEHLRSIRSTLARHDEQFDTMIMRLCLLYTSPSPRD